MIHMEDKRVLYQVSEEQCWRHFTPLLDVNTRAHLDDVMELTATMGGSDAANLSWENLVWQAWHTATSSKLAPEWVKVSVGIIGFGPVKIAKPTLVVATALHIVNWKECCTIGLAV